MSSMIMNSVLCFLQSAYNDYSKEAIFEIIYSFYSENEIFEAKSTLCNTLKHDLKSRREPNKKRKDLEDIMEMFSVFMNFENNSTIFVSNSYKNMPPSGFDTISPVLTSLLAEVAKLKEDYLLHTTSVKELSLEMNNLSNDGKMNQILLQNVATKDDVLELKQSIRSLTRVNLGMEVRRLSDVSNFIPSTQHTVASQISEASCADDTLLGNFVSDLRFDEAPTAPNLSLLEMNDNPEGECHGDQHQFSTNLKNKELKYNTVAAKPPINNNELKKRKNSFLKRPPLIVVKDSNVEDESKSKLLSTDEDGFTEVRNRKIRKITTGTKTNFSSTSFKSAMRYADLYIGRCAEDTTTEKLTEYLTTELSIEPRSCQKINTKVPYSTAFKLTVNFNDRKKLFIPNSWPEGVICKKYFVSNK